MRIVPTVTELKGIMKSALAGMERARLAKVEARRAAQDVKMRVLLAQRSKSMRKRDDLEGGNGLGS